MWASLSGGTSGSGSLSQRVADKTGASGAADAVSLRTMYPSRLPRPALASSWRLVHEFAGHSRRGVREHWLFSIIAVCGTALRVVVQLAYQQAFIFPDSERYLQYAHNFLTGNWSPDWLRTSGYSLLLMPAVLAHNLSVVVAIQHLLGLATAVLIYATLIHFGARRWLAALATIPVLFDPLQLDLEQYILTDVCATFLVFLALVVLVGRREALGKRAALTAGLLVAAATIIRESDLLVMIPALLYVVAVIRPWRRCARLAGGGGPGRGPPRPRAVWGGRGGGAGGRL